MILNKVYNSLIGFFEEKKKNVSGIYRFSCINNCFKHKRFFIIFDNGTRRKFAVKTKELCEKLNFAQFK